MDYLSTEETKMKLLLFIALILIVTTVNAGDTYECRTFGDNDSSLILPAPAKSSVWVEITYLGKPLFTYYERSELDQYWFLSIDPEMYIELTPDLVAYYRDFTGAKDGEEMAPTAIFRCIQVINNRTTF